MSSRILKNNSYFSSCAPKIKKTFLELCGWALAYFRQFWRRHWAEPHLPLYIEGVAYPLFAMRFICPWSRVGTCSNPRWFNARHINQIVVRPNFIAHTIWHEAHQIILDWSSNDDIIDCRQDFQQFVKFSLAWESVFMYKSHLQVFAVGTLVFAKMAQWNLTAAVEKLLMSGYTKTKKNLIVISKQCPVLLCVMQSAWNLHIYVNLLIISEFIYN